MKGKINIQKGKSHDINMIPNLYKYALYKYIYTKKRKVK